MAVKAADFTLIEGAPTWLSANWWNYVPLTLISIFVVIALYRQFRPHEALPEAAPAPEAAPTAETRDRDRHRERQRVIEALDYAKRHAAASMADVSSSGRELAASRAMPEMKAAMLSANKEFGIPIPPQGESVVMSLQMQGLMIDKILPLLRAGHIEEAQQEAEALIGKIVSWFDDQKKA